MASTLWSSLYGENKLRYHVIPPVFLLFFTSIVQLLAIVGRGETFGLDQVWKNLAGNPTAWNWLVVVCLWAFYSLKISNKTVLGPETPFGYKPIYQVNIFFNVDLFGFLYRFCCRIMDFRTTL